jgi:hypothetical protein
MLSLLSLSDLCLICCSGAICRAQDWRLADEGSSVCPAKQHPLYRTVIATPSCLPKQTLYAIVQASLCLQITSQLVLPSIRNTLPTSRHHGEVRQFFSLHPLCSLSNVIPFWQTRVPARFSKPYRPNSSRRAGRFSR